MGSILGRNEGRQVREHALAGHLRDLYPTFDSLVEASEAVASLVEHPGWSHVTRLLAAEREALDGAMDGRLLDTRSDYAFKHGQRRGLAAAENAAGVILRRAELRLSEQRAKHEADDGRAVTAGGS